MTDGLKTLNDMKEDLRYSGGQGLFTDSTFIDSYKLKTEAIKRVNILQKKISQGIAYDFKISKIEWEAQIKILRIVFNITNEDLK